MTEKDSDANPKGEDLEREPTLNDLDVPESEAGSVTGGAVPLSDINITKKIDKASPGP